MKILGEKEIQIVFCLRQYSIISTVLYTADKINYYNFWNATPDDD